MNPRDSREISQSCTGGWLSHFYFTYLGTMTEEYAQCTGCLSAGTRENGPEAAFRLRGTEPGHRHSKSSLLSAALMTKSLRETSSGKKLQL